MAIFTISYDLIKRKDYQTLWDALEKQGAQRALESLWVLSANNTAAEVLKWLRQFVDNDDRLFVCKTSSNDIVYINAKAGTKNWLAAA